MIRLYRLAHLKGKDTERPASRKGMSDDELRAMASGTSASDRMQEEEDLDDVQGMIEQAAKELQLDAEKTVEGIALETSNISFTAEKSPTISYENNRGYSQACPVTGLMHIFVWRNNNFPNKL